MLASIIQVQSHYSLYSFWTRLKWLKITQFFCLENFKRRSWKTKLENCHEPSNKSEITGFYMEKRANFLWVFTSFLSPYFCNRPLCGRNCCKSSILSVAVEADGSPAPTLWSSLLSPSLPSKLLLLNRSCWFLSINPFCHVCQIYKLLHHFFWGIVTINNSVYERNALTIGCIYYLNEFTAWQVCVTCLSSISLVCRSK